MTLLLGLLGLWRFWLPQTRPGSDLRALIPAQRAADGPYPPTRTLARLVHAPTPHLLS
jgi:hypothetical protein